MSTCILLHGAWHGAWAWTCVAKHIRGAGHRVLAPSLPGHGANRLPLSTLTMDTYVSRIVRLLDQEDEPVVLIGHSMGGAVVSQAAELRPEKVSRLIFVSAFLLTDGRSVLGAMQEDRNGQLLPRLHFNEDRSGARLDESTLREVIYNETPEEWFRWAVPQLIEFQPLQPLAAPVRLSAQRFGRIPRVYVRCLRDRLLSPQAQQKAIDAQPCEQVFDLDTDHVPFLSRPEELARALLAA